MGNYTNMNYGSGIVNEFQINNTWDGQPAASCYNAATNPYGRDCSREWFHYFDHLHISETHGAPAPFYIVTSTFSNPRTGTPFTATLQATGGTTPYQQFLESGSLPPGLSLSQSGTISGSPTCAGRSNFAIRVVDASSPALTSTKSYSMVVSGTPACASSIETGIEARPNIAQFKATATRGNVKFHLPQAQGGARHLSVFDFSGKRIYGFTTVDPRTAVMKADLKTGVYLAQLKSGTYVNVCRFQVMN